jgi:hypothetical protein
MERGILVSARSEVDMLRDQRTLMVTLPLASIDIVGRARRRSRALFSSMLIWVLASTLPVSARAQLPHNMPRFCANGLVVRNQEVVTLDRQTIPCLRVERGGRVVLNDSADVAIGTLQILEGGSFEGAYDGISARLTVLDHPLDEALDPEQYGTGILVLGRFQLRGVDKTPFLRVAVEPRAGQVRLTMKEVPSGWRPGDRVFIPDTRQVPSNRRYDPSFGLQHEARTIAGLDGPHVTLDRPLEFDHLGARDADGTPTVLSDGTALLPHVANLSRSIVIRSAEPDGRRGHFLATHRAAVDVRGVAFQDMGRTRATALDSAILANGRATRPGTNQIGRYPLHIHLLMGPVNEANRGYQFSLVGNVVERSEKWPIAIHGSHFGLIEHNVIVGGERLTGAGLALEDGSETENLVRRNFIADIRGNINPRYSGPSTENGTTPGSAGECLWGAGWNNRFVENVMTGCRNPVQGVASGPGVKFVTLPPGVRVRNPRVRGADMTSARQTVDVTVGNQPILQFDGNEVYGIAATGLTTWLIGTNGYRWNASQTESLIRDFKVWNTYGGALWSYPAQKLTFERLIYRVDPAQPTAPVAITAGDYRLVDLTVRDSSVHAGGMMAAVTDPIGTYHFERNNIVSRGDAFWFVTPRTPGTQAPRTVGVTMRLISNVVAPWPNQSLRTIRMEHTGPGGDTRNPFVVEVKGHQGVAGEDFRVYFAEQATSLVYGSVAPPAATTRPDISGLVHAVESAPRTPGVKGERQTP